MSYAVLTNANVGTQSRGMVVRKNTSGTCLLAKADTADNASDLLGCRLTDVVASASGPVAGFANANVVRLAGAATDGDRIYLSDSVDGVGTNVAPAIAVLLGYAYHTYQAAGVWYAELIVVSLNVPPLLTRLSSGDVNSTNQTDWVAIGNLLHLKPGIYQINSLLQFTADAAAGIEVNLSPGGALSTDQTFDLSVGEIYQRLPSVALVTMETIDPMFSSGKFSATGPTDGYAKISGLIKVLVEGDLGWTFRQKVTNVVPTSVHMSAYFQAVRI